MATLLYVTLSGSDDPVKASFPFLAANGAVGAGHQAQIFLVGDAVVVMKDAIASTLNPMGWPSLVDLLGTTSKHQIPIYV